MRISEDRDSLVIECPAKVNLFLEVADKRPDGYHGLITIMHAVSLCDELRIFPSDDGSIQLECENTDVPTGPENLVLRAARALQDRSGYDGGAHFDLLKRGPVGGGLGSGSSNCAGALVGLNRVWDLGLPKKELHRIAAGLGSDINFFLEGGTALCTGRGEVVRPLDIDWEMHFVLFMPHFAVSTAKAFEAMSNFLIPQIKDVSIVLDALMRKDFPAVCEKLYNRLEAPVFQIYPDLVRLKRRIEAAVPGRVLLSGSGSTLFCLCEDYEEAIEGEKGLEKLQSGTVCRAENYCR